MAPTMTTKPRTEAKIKAPLCVQSINLPSRVNRSLSTSTSVMWLTTLVVSKGGNVTVLSLFLRKRVLSVGQLRSCLVSRFA